MTSTDKPDVQLILLAIMPKVSSLLSILGSSALLAECLYYDRRRLERVMYRVLCTVATFDILESVWNFASTWAMSENDGNATFVVGNDATCAAQGFFLQLGVTNPILNAALTFYYLFIIRFSWTEEEIKKAAEPWFYGVSIIWGLATSIAGLPLELYGPSGSSWCWIKDDADTNKYYRLGFYFIPLFACFIIIAYNMFLLAWTVRSLEALSNRYLKSAYEKKAKNSSKTVKRSVRRLTHVMRLTKSRDAKNSVENKASDTDKDEAQGGTRPLIRNTHSQRLAQLAAKQRSIARRAANPAVYSKSFDTGGVLALKAKKRQEKNGSPNAEKIDAQRRPSPPVGFGDGRYESAAGTVDFATKPKLPTIDSGKILMHKESLGMSWIKPVGLSESIVEELESPVANEPQTNESGVTEEATNRRMSSVKFGDAVTEYSAEKPMSIPKVKSSVFNFRNPNTMRKLSLRSHNSEVSDAPSWVKRRSIARKANKKKKSKSRQVTEQALCYVFSFLLTFTWSAVVRLLEFSFDENYDPPFWLKLGNAFFDPLQGFINYLVYIRPKYIGCRQRYPHKTRIQILHCLITHQELSRDEDKETEDGARRELLEWRELASGEKPNASDSSIEVDVLKGAEISAIGASRESRLGRLSSDSSQCFEEEKVEIQPCHISYL